ncbi:uncharacterized protein LOC108241503 [Kryptolebias marmoratus]|uniref:uncharacterized protein LOC108241503 n=1 Tax=Kryptolebias marmoratus TaxID=37003 RepID=UPI0007F8D023|nr:uncharacterized protein LOC108241503 [Kryptolebias marmoratus]
MSSRRPAESSSWSKLAFDGDEKNYELWETRFLEHLGSQGLKDAILSEPTRGESDEDSETEEDGEKNAEAYAELVRCLDDKSLSLVTRDAADDGRRALRILRDHYAGKGKPQMVNLYAELTSLTKLDGESLTEYIIRAETAITALRDAGETLSDGLLTAMVLKGLPESFRPFSVTQSGKTMTFAEFKTKLWNYEAPKRMPDDNNAMKASEQLGGLSPTRSREDTVDIACHKCGLKGHRVRICQRKQWCRRCKSATHQDATCRRKQPQANARKVLEDSSSSKYAFRMRDEEASIQPSQGGKATGVMVDTVAISHVTMDTANSRTFDDDLQPETHSVKLVERKGQAEICLTDSKGQRQKTRLNQTSYSPSYLQNIVSVAARGKKKRKRCQVCKSSDDVKTSMTCVKCAKFICTKHTVMTCPSCAV